MKFYFHRFFNAALDWFFRRKSLALVSMRIGFGCLALSFGAGWVFDVSLPFQNGQIDFTFNSAGGTPAILVYSAAFFGFALMTFGLIWEAIRLRNEQRRLAQKKVIVIEARGLRDTSGTPLSDAIPDTLEGHPEQVMVDLRQRVRDGFIIDPSRAVENLKSLPIDLSRRESGLNRSDISLVYGGMTPVPLTFLTGVLLSSQGKITVMDWNRHEELWSELHGPDDGDRFNTSGLNLIPVNTYEVALMVSVSYEVKTQDVRLKLGDLPTIQMDLPNQSVNCHWSEQKQVALGQQFLDTVITLKNLGISKIHLFIGAQNSIVFRFGRLYDTRNLPEVIVYQYQQEETPPFPWGVRIPVGGVTNPEVV